MTRLLVGWGNQGEILPNVIQPGSTTKTATFGKRDEKLKLQQGHQYVVLVDKKNKLSSRQQLSAFAMVSPGLIRDTLRSQSLLFSTNETIIEWIADLPKGLWDVRKLRITKNLDAFVVTPAAAR